MFAMDINLLQVNFLRHTMPRLAPPLRHLIFVYGTLKRGLINHERYLALAEEHGAARFVGGGVTTERFPLIVLPTERYSRQPPALLERRGVGNRVRGELFVVDDRTLEGLDILEGSYGRTKQTAYMFL